MYTLVISLLVYASSRAVMQLCIFLLFGGQCLEAGCFFPADAMFLKTSPVCPETAPSISVQEQPNAECTCSPALQLDRYRVEGLELYSSVLWHLRKETDLCYLAKDAMATDRLAPQVLHSMLLNVVWNNFTEYSIWVSSISITP